MKIRVVIAERQQLFRDAVRALLVQEPGLTVVDVTGDAAELLRIVGLKRTDVVCLDGRLHRKDGVDIVKQLIELRPGLKIIGLAEKIDWPTVRDLVKSGARGYLSKSADFDELITAIRTVVTTDRRYFCRRVTESVMAAVFDEAAGLTLPPLLTPREQDVLKLIAKGFTAAEIGNQLGLTEATVRSYRGSLMRSLGLHTAPELTRYVISQGLGSPLSSLPATPPQAAS